LLLVRPTAHVATVREGSVRVYELARQLGAGSKEILSKCAELGIAAETASSGLDPAEVALIERAFTPANGEITQFDKRTGRGQITFGNQRNVPFDLRSTRIANERFIAMRPGTKVDFEMIDDQVKSITAKS
jgi:hypothetical protein